MQDKQHTNELPDNEAIKRFEDTVRRMANTPPAPQPKKEPKRGDIQRKRRER